MDGILDRPLEGVVEGVVLRGQWTEQLSYILPHAHHQMERWFVASHQCIQQRTEAPQWITFHCSLHHSQPFILQFEPFSLFLNFLPNFIYPLHHMLCSLLVQVLCTSQETCYPHSFPPLQHILIYFTSLFFIISIFVMLRLKDKTKL